MALQAMEAIRDGRIFDSGLIARMRAIAIRGLARMYRPRERMFGHCIRRGPAGDVLEGVSRRYTAITAIGLAPESDSTVREVLAGHSPSDLCDRLLSDVQGVENLGDVALTLWAAGAIDSHDAQPALDRLIQLLNTSDSVPTVELSWALTALARTDAHAARPMRDKTARRLLQAFERRTGLFRHTAGGAGPAFRRHVACFADVVYPVQALSLYHAAVGSNEAIDAAGACATIACELMGAAGQWWWHYDVRAGRVVEKYPVYSVHQDAMAPMAILDLHECGGPDLSAYAQLGLDWLVSSPELNGKSLLDDSASMIWRKVARREPRKLVRRMQTVLSAVHPAFRVPAVDSLFPANAVDWECRPYHLGWLLHAWSPSRLAKWGFSDELDAGAEGARR